MGEVTSYTKDKIDELIAGVAGGGTLVETDGHTAQSVPVSVAGTLADVAIPASSFFGRKATGDVGPITPTEARVIVGITVGAVAPSSPAVNDIWIDTTT